MNNNSIQSFTPRHDCLFGLMDCNNFYASCERVFRPDLRGKPVVVLSNNDGCVIARSNEAKELGIPMGAPAFKFQEHFDRHGVAVFSSNFALYGDMSARVMGIVADFAPEMEIYSIDEAFMKFDGIELIDMQALGETIKRAVTRGTGVPVSIGFGTTKTLAKVANRVAKKFPEQTRGVYIIDTEEKRVKALRWLAVDDVWGIGSRHAKKLHAMKVKTADDFTRLSDQWVRNHMSVVGLRLKKELLGEPGHDLEEHKPKQSIATTRSFEQAYTELEQVEERVMTFAVSCAEKLRAQHSHCNALMVFIHTNGFRDDQLQYSKNIVIKLPFPTSSSIELARFASAGLRAIFKKGYYYKKAGVIVMDVTPESNTQLTFFDNSDPRHRPLMEAIDKINNRMGQHKVKLAAQDMKRAWKMKQERLSPRYSTNIMDIITVKA